MPVLCRFYVLVNCMYNLEYFAYINTSISGQFKYNIWPFERIVAWYVINCLWHTWACAGFPQGLENRENREKNNGQGKVREKSGNFILGQKSGKSQGILF